MQMQCDICAIRMPPYLFVNLSLDVSDELMTLFSRRCRRSNYYIDQVINTCNLCSDVHVFVCRVLVRLCIFSRLYIAEAEVRD